MSPLTMWEPWTSPGWTRAVMKTQGLSANLKGRASVSIVGRSGIGSSRSVSFPLWAVMVKRSRRRPSTEWESSSRWK
jgi:hypothetical protein